MENLDLGNEAVSYMGYKAQAKTWVVDGTECNIKKLLIDPESIRIGQGKLAAGVAPDWKWNEYPGEKVKLIDGYKKAFCITVYLSDKYGAPENSWKDWVTNQRASREALSRVWKDVNSGMESNKGKMAILEISDIKAEKFGEATVNVPVFKLAGWTKKPGETKKAEPEIELKDDLEF